MKKIFVFICLLVYLSIGLLPKAYAQVSSQSGKVNISVTIKGLSLAISGFIAPFASVVLTTNNNVVASTTADAQGNFSFAANLPVGSTGFCLDAIDFKRLGESESCFTIPASQTSYSKIGIFLPPTLGLFRTQVNTGSNAIAFGYGMPGEQVTVHFNNSVGCQVTADNTGYFSCNIPITTPGNYTLYADGTLNQKPSEPQLKKILLLGLSLPKQPTVAPNVINQLGNLLPNIPWWGYLLLLLILLIIVLLLIRKFKPKWLPVPKVPQVSFKHAWDEVFRERKLHHHWIVGY